METRVGREDESTRAYCGKGSTIGIRGRLFGVERFLRQFFRFRRRRYQRVDPDEDRSANEAGVGDIEVWPRVVADHDEYPVADGVNRFADHLRGTVPYFDVEGAPRHVVKGATIPQVAEDARGDEPKSEREVATPCDVGPDPPADTRQGDERECDEKGDLSLTDAKERALIEGRLEAENFRNDPPNAFFAGPSERLKNPMFRPKIEQETAKSDN